MSVDFERCPNCNMPCLTETSDGIECTNCEYVEGFPGDDEVDLEDFDDDDYDPDDEDDYDEDERYY